MRKTLAIVATTYLVIAAAYGGAVALQGCASRVKTVTNLPAGVPQSTVQSWDAAVSDLHQIATINALVRTTATSLNQTTYLDANGQPEKILPDGGAYAAILTGSGKVDEAEIAAVNFLEGVPQDWTQATQQKISSYAQQILTQAQAMISEGTVGVKATASQNTINGIIQNLIALAKALQTV